VNAVVVANMRNELRSTAGFSWQGYMNAAQYCVGNNVNTDEALVWIEKSIKMNRNAQNLVVKSRLLQQKSEIAKSKEVIDEAIKMADIIQLNAIGYQLIASGDVDKAIEIFKLNVERNPKDANVHDSLGEAYKIKGEKELAIKSFKKSLTLDPPPNVKSNSLKHLKELGVSL
jgi:tetratricopeptide (TPR) repeat protein